MVTDCAVVKVPAAGENVGVATKGSAGPIVYVADATPLLVSPGAAAIASNISVELTIIGPVYAAEDVVGTVPSVV
jgi:hypothetical protein